MVSFVILHYKNIVDTLECIKSIKKMNASKEYSIVVVDNFSMSDTDLIEIQKHTQDIILNERNLGFANANNIGCRYAISKYNPDFLIVINNDTLIKQDDFLEKIYEIYKETSFDMLGPKIITDGGDSVNPFPVYKTEDEIITNIKKAKILVKIYQNKLLRLLLKIYIKIKALFKKKVESKNGESILKNVALHGCAIIFSKKYYQKYNDVFYNDTFLYHEEEFLFYRIVRDHLISIYNPSLEIFHKEGASLNNDFDKRYYDKLIFKYTNIIVSLEKLLDIIKSGKGI